MSQTSSKSPRVGVYPGSFDPMHNGHLDLIERSAPLFDTFYVAVLYNEAKKALFSAEERVAAIEELVAPLGNCRVETFTGLLVDYARDRGVTTVVRGLRSTTDFDYELPMTLMNRHLAPAVDTIFLLPRQDCLHLSSRLIKEVCGLGGDVSELVPPSIHGPLLAKFD
ncbi:MAG: pantetheine-phosphate adenylyltransferase [Acidobacteriota bacterium]